MTCPSRYQLACHEAAAPDSLQRAILARHVDGCGRCGAVLVELTEARTLLLGGELQRRSHQAADAIVARAARQRMERWPLRWLPVGLLPLAAAVVLFVVRPMEPHSSTRVKGALVVEAYAKRGDEVFPVETGGELLAGDRLRFSYTKALPGHLMVFGVDDSGQVFPYYGDSVLGDIRVGAGSRVMLPGSVELDGHRGWERVFVLWSPREISPDLVRRAVRQGMHAAGRDIRKVDRLGVNVDQVSYLLRRP